MLRSLLVLIRQASLSSSISLLETSLRHLPTNSFQPSQPGPSSFNLPGGFQNNTIFPLSFSALAWTILIVLLLCFVIYNVARHSKFGHSGLSLNLLSFRWSFQNSISTPLPSIPHFTQLSHFWSIRHYISLWHYRHYGIVHSWPDSFCNRPIPKKQNWTKRLSSCLSDFPNKSLYHIPSQFNATSKYLYQHRQLLYRRQLQTLPNLAKTHSEFTFKPHLSYSFISFLVIYSMW